LKVDLIVFLVKGLEAADWERGMRLNNFTTNRNRRTATRNNFEYLKQFDKASFRIFN
jgi:hypothetical protein